MTRKPLNKTSNYGGGQLTLQNEPINIKQTTDIWRLWQVFGFSNLQTIFAQSEAIYAPEAKSKFFRESLINYPAIGPAAQVSVVETQIISSLDRQGRPEQNSLRERDRSVIPLTPLIWIGSLFYAFNTEYRADFISNMLLYGHVPAFTIEVFKRTRHVNTAAYRIVTSVVNTSWDLLVAANPTLANTFFDPAFLGSRNGVLAYTQFLLHIHHAEGNYIPFVSCNKDNLPPFEAGTASTFSSYSTALSSDFLRGVVYVIDNMVPFIGAAYVQDCLIASCSYRNMDNTEYANHQAGAQKVLCVNTTLGIVNYIVGRILQFETNDTNNNKSKEETFSLDKPDSQGSSASESKEGYLQKPRTKFNKPKFSKKAKDDSSSAFLGYGVIKDLISKELKHLLPLFIKQSLSDLLYNKQNLTLATT